MNTSAAGSSTLRVAVDIGGTFTDGVATLYPQGRIWVGKTPTTPSDPGEAVSTVIGDLLRQVAGSMGGAAPQLGEVLHGTTLVTNTLIERKGAATGLITTAGMRDALDIGREWRYDPYDLDIVLPQPLVPPECRAEVAERLGAHGDVLEPLDDADVAAAIQALADAGVASVAVSLLHAYMDDSHERRIEAAIKQRLPGMAVSTSSSLAREIGEFERTSTTTANAYVKPVVADYLRQLEARIGDIRRGIPLRVMVSSGGFTSAQAGAESPIMLLESGPAAGVLSALNTARENDVDQVLAFDMGGTTAKACVAIDGEAPVAHSFECARVERFKRGSGLPILIPSIELIEIGAGGGSIAYCNRLGLLNVGPESSGSVPGPVCYGRGGAQPTVTDADLLLGYLNPANFLGGEMALDLDATRAAMARLGQQLEMPAESVAWGICNMVNENMASAARIHIAETGHDPRDLSMVATGGAGPVHAVDVARKLRIPRVLVPIAAGAGSCLGMLAAPARVDRAWSSPQLLAETDWSQVARVLSELKQEGEAELASVGASDVEWRIGADMRYYGQGAEVPVSIPYAEVDAGTGARVLAAFEEQYQRLYGRLVPNARPQVTTWRLVGKARTEGSHFEWGDTRTSGGAPAGSRPVYLPLRRAYGEVPVHDRYSLPAGITLQGPLILEERESTLVVAVAADVTILPDLTVSVTIKEFE
ncbi:MAG: 5-oxoprolinase [Bordetella sp. SCN 67-23]|nr:MAG: 5-oxoprolinase [Bordetella sp. SCN 67-23]OJW87827.1 MAG: 5-oxoprolinase [Burkholderiales bacterium 67-32]